MAEVLAPSGPHTKRDRLLAAARQLFYEQGVERTTLVDISIGATVPLGNLYYYFKTKDELAVAVVELQLSELRRALSLLDQLESPADRLKAFVEWLTSRVDEIARFGCPHGSLCLELSKASAMAAPGVARLLLVPIEWTATQFRLLGRSDAPGLALQLIAAYQGTAILSGVLGQPELMQQEGRRLHAWIDSLMTA
jgi:TetR/AcrR family transcriptional repressor of nem operon